MSSKNEGQGVADAAPADIKPYSDADIEAIKAEVRQECSQAIANAVAAAKPDVQFTTEEFDAFNARIEKTLRDVVAQEQADEIKARGHISLDPDRLKPLVQSISDNSANNTRSVIFEKLAGEIAKLRAEAARQDGLGAGDPVKSRYFKYFADALDAVVKELE